MQKLKNPKPDQDQGIHLVRQAITAQLIQQHAASLNFQIAHLDRESSVQTRKSCIFVKCHLQMLALQHTTPAEGLTPPVIAVFLT